MVWSIAFNRKAIDDEVAEVVLQTIRSKSEELGETIHEIEVMDQCYVECYFPRHRRYVSLTILKQQNQHPPNRPSKHTQNSGTNAIRDCCGISPSLLSR